MAWTTADHVIDSWIGDDAPSDTNLIDVWIGRAERLVRFRVPGIQARVDASEPDLIENIMDVVSAMVIRKFRNPEGFRTTSETTGPFSTARTYGGDDPGELTLLDSELAILAGDVADGRSAFTIDLIPSASPFSPQYTPGV